MRPRRSAWVGVLALSAASLLAGCGGPGTMADDPLEPFNRRMYSLDDQLDRFVLDPLSQVYVGIVPRPVRTSVGHFLDNLGMPGVFVNDFLQGKWRQGGADLGRFLVNSTIGIGGLADPATGMGLEEHDEDLGQTLAVWGLGPGPYLVLPFFGPTTLRDAPSLAFTSVVSVPVATGSTAGNETLLAVTAADGRARADEALEAREREALDPYVFTREAFLQRRIFLIYDGHPPPPEIPAGPSDDDDLGLDLGGSNP